MTDARTALLDAAERLYAERGVGSVSLREVGAAAGQRNNSAAQYHFGSRDGLLRAVFERRMVPIDEQRQRMLDAIAPSAEDAGERRALLAAIVVPLTDAVAATPDSCYARFLAQVLSSDVVAGNSREPFTAAYRAASARLAAGLDHLPPTIARLRLDHAVLLVVGALARWEQARADGVAVLDPDLLATELVDSCLGLLDAPSTAHARADRHPAPTPAEIAC